MASLFEEYEQFGSQPTMRTTERQVAANPVKKLLKPETEVPIFKKMKIEYIPSQPLTHMVVSNDILLLAMLNKMLIKVELKHPEVPEELPLYSQLPGASGQYRVQGLFLDPLGNHLIVSLNQPEGPGENFYIYLGGGKVRSYVKVLRGQLVTSVAFNAENTMTCSTGSILIGTNKGCVYEAEFLNTEDRLFVKQNSPEKFCKLIYQLKNEVSITGLHMEQISSPGGGTPQTVVYLSTPRCLYQFFGISTQSFENNACFESIFTSSEAKAYKEHREWPNQTKSSSLRVLVPKGLKVPSHMALLIGPVGVYHADLSVKAGNDGSWLVWSEEPSHLEFTPHQTELSPDQQPLALALTNYHLLVLFPDRLRCYCQLNDEVVMEDMFPNVKMVGLTRDSVSGIVWAFSENGVYRYKVTREDRHMWRVLLSLKKYDEAKVFCHGDPVKINKILVKYAQDRFTEGDYENSARLFADSWASFEEVSLRFLEMDQDSALKILLRQKLGQLKADEKPQMTMVSTWLLQLYLNRMANLKNQLSRDEDGRKCQEYKGLEKDMRELLSSPDIKAIVMEHKQPFYKLIANHGDEALLIEFASLIEDHARVVKHHLQQKRFADALGVIRSHSTPELYYSFSPELMAHLPEQVVNSWIAAGRTLDPAKLIPSLVQYSGDQFDPESPQVKQSIRYLTFCVNDLRSQNESLHNYLISLYARLKSTSELEEYLENQGDDCSMVSYDVKYALRVCCDFNLHKPCMHIYTTMGLFEEAVDLALTVLKDIEVAKDIANRPLDDDDTKKKLWLMIAKHVVSAKQDIGLAMEFLQSCELLKIEDILPFFPEFACIDHFKEAICESLQDYKCVIQELQGEMNTSTEAADQIREEIHQVKNRCFVVDISHKCVICGYAVLNQSFYLFPCKHMFHADCLYQEVLPYLKPDERTRVESLIGQLNSVCHSTQTNSNIDTSSMASSSAPVLSERERITNNLTDNIASECLFCGELIAECIGEPFFGKEEYEKTLRQWL